MATRKREVRTTEPRRTNVRPHASSFVGRSEELERIAALFEEGRLVTLVGPGGIGKTRLALRHAEARLPALSKPSRGGVWFVDLAEVTTGSDAVAAIAATLGIALERGAGERAKTELLGREIGNLGPLLVVLDNLEQLATPFARLLSEWIPLTPGARWLVTTRLVLGIPGEHTLTLGPLGAADASTLFLERARGVRALGASEAEPEAVCAIVDAIDRMPLAIELAASRTRVLSTNELRRRLVRPSGVLAGGSTERHASMHRVVVDSLALVTAEVRRAFALASTLRNGFSLEAAESTLGAVLSTPAFESIELLVRSSLLRVEHTEGHPARYGFFEAIREVAQQMATEDPGRDAARVAHAAHYAALAARARASTEASAAQALLERELDNLLAAALTSTALARRRADGGAASDAATILLAVEPLLSRRGQSAARNHSLTDVLEVLDSTGAATRSLRAEALSCRGSARRELGDMEQARADFEAALASCEADQVGTRALALARLGDVLDLQGDTAGARAHLDAALALLAVTPEGTVRSAREAEALVRLGHAHRREGALEAAQVAIFSAARRFRALDDDEGLASALYELGVVAMFRARDPEAFAHFDEGLAVARRAGIPIMEGACLTARGCLLQDLGRLDEALAHHAHAARIFRDRGSALREGSALHYLATTYLERGEPAEAATLIDQARARLEVVGAPRYDVLTRGARALAFAALGHAAEGRAELDAAEAALTLVPDEPALAAVVAIHRATIAADVGFDGLALEEARARVRAHPSDDSRFALRALERRTRPAAASSAKSEALRVWGAGEAFAAPGAARVDLPPRSPLRRILHHLAARRAIAPGEPVLIDEIVRVGWPGERMGSDAALNRAYVAIATLRKRGLRDAIVRAGGGYALSRAVRVERVATD